MTNQPTAVFVHSDALKTNAYPPTCPFDSSRAEKTRKLIMSMGLLSPEHGIAVEAHPADQDYLETFHTKDYLRVLREAAGGILAEEGLHMGLGTGDTPIFRGLYEHSALVAGATLTGARLIAERKANVAVNYSGGLHHAFAARAGGFCYINDVVLACLYLAKQGMRVLFLDIDAHHCDGVQSAFYSRKDVMTISFHESPQTLFPGTGFVHEIGNGDGKGYTVNIPLPPKTYDSAYLSAFEQIALPLIDAYNPDVMVLELGLDVLAGDPLTHLNLTNNTHAEICESITRIGKPILAVGGGGYNVRNTVRGWTLLWSILSGAGTHDEMMFGLGGVMLESTDWRGGLRDRALVPHDEDCLNVDTEISKVVEALKRHVFPLHGL